MNSNLRNFLLVIGTAVVIFLFWYFRSIVAYILVAGVLSLVGRPVVDLLNKIHFRKLRFPKALSALLTLALIWGLLAVFFAVFIPLISKQIETLSRINADEIVKLASEQLAKVEAILRKVNKDLPVDMSLYQMAVEKVGSVLNISIITNFAGSIISKLGNLAIAFFSISFIAFFFLKDEGLFYETLMVAIPEKYEEKIRRALQSIKNLLIRYFIGIIIESTIVMIIVTIGMTIVGMSFQQAMVMGLIVGIFNVIPYVGPWLGGAIVLVMGIGTTITAGGMTEVPWLIIGMMVVIAIAQFIDNNLVQPLIYSKSVNAHPIEIFLVILAAGSFAGITGMILAVPAYTALRVLAREFFYNFGPVRRITSGLGKDRKEELL